MNAQAILENDEKVFEITEQLRIAYQLKRTLRYAGERDLTVHGESVAEHVFALQFLAQYFLPLEDPEGKIDRTRLYEILLFHDFGEIPSGDIPYHIKTEADEEKEREDALAVFASLPEPLNTIGRERWEEYEAGKTLEAKFAIALDKIEPVFELLDPVNEQSLKRLKFTYDMHVERKRNVMDSFPVMLHFTEVLANDMRARGVFWEE